MNSAITGSLETLPGCGERSTVERIADDTGSERCLVNLLPDVEPIPWEALANAEPRGDGMLRDHLLEQGRELLEQGRYEEADRALSAARDLRIDHAPTLASLALARARNPALPAEERQHDVDRLLCMAAQLAPTDPIVLSALSEARGVAPLDVFPHSTLDRLASAS